MTSQTVVSTPASRFTATPLCTSVLAPLIAKELPKKENPPNFTFEPNAMESAMDRVHALTERLYALLTLSCVSKGFKEATQKARTELRERIVLEITLIHEGVDGSKALRDLVNSGGYLRALRVYFFVKPQALHNFVSDEQRQPPFCQNILHNAAYPRQGASKISEPFIAFVLDMDLQHNLGLSKHQDLYDRTPLQFCRQQMVVPHKRPELVHYQRVEQRLLAHEAALPPIAVLDPAPKVVSAAPKVLELPQSLPAFEALPPPPKPPESPSLKPPKA